MVKKSSAVTPSPDPISTYFKAYWQGQMPLWGAFWLWGMAVGTLVGIVFTLLSLVLLGQFSLLLYTGSDPLMTLLSGYILLITYGFWLTYYTWHVVGVWRCSAHAAPLAKWAARLFVGAVTLTYWPLYGLTVWLRFF